MRRQRQAVRDNDDNTHPSDLRKSLRTFCPSSSQHAESAGRAVGVDVGMLPDLPRRAPSEKLSAWRQCPIKSDMARHYRGIPLLPGARSKGAIGGDLCTIRICSFVLRRCSPTRATDHAHVSLAN